jgi:hypothetical protein
MKRANFFLFLSILFSANVIGQKASLGKVTKSELLEKQHKTDTSAEAAIIFKKAKTIFTFREENGFTSETVFQVKLKVYKKEGLQWANFRIPYYIGYQNIEDEQVAIISGYTYNLEDDKIVKSKVSGESKFKEKVNEDWEVKSVAFPNVKAGSIIELEYRFKSENIGTLPEFQYQYSIPVDYAEYRTEIPEFYIYKGIKKGFVDLTTNQKMESASQAFEAKVGFTKETRSLSYKQITTVYTANDISALKEEDFVNNIDNYYAEIDHELQVIRMPDKDPKQIATTWDDIAKSIYDDKDFKAAATAYDYFTNDIRSTINGLTSNEEKTKKIFSFVKNKMNWNGKFGYYPRRKQEAVYADKVGSVAEINLMLVSMLRMAGVEANPVLVSTRQNGFANFPNRSLFNYVIVAAQINDAIILMDATDKLSDLNMLPIRTLNWQGRLIKIEGTSAEIDLMPKSNSKDNINIMGSINQQGEISGKIREQYFDYNAFVFRSKYNGIAKESYIEKLEKKNQGLEIIEYSVQNSLDLELPIVENYNFISTNSVEIIGDKMYLSPFLFFAKTENPFKQETRVYPVDFVFPTQDKLNISLTIPDGYAVETLPQSKAIAMPENLGNFKYNISNNGNQIQLLYTQDINQAVIEPEYYEALKNFFKEIVIKQTEKIVLKKV